MARSLPQADRLARRRQLRTELLGLHESPLGELGTRDARREAEVVLDPGARPGLAARGDHVDAERPETLRRSVDGGGQTGWASPDDDQIEAALRQALDGQAQIVGEHARRGTSKDLARRDHDRKVGRLKTECARPWLSTCGSLSGSNHSWGIRVRERNSRSWSTSGEKREPMTRVAGPAPVMSSLRRAMNVARILSLSCGCVAMMRRSSSTGMARSSPASATRADDEDPQARQQVQFAEETSWSVRDDDPLFAVDVEDDLDQPGKDDVEVVAGVARPVEVLARVRHRRLPYGSNSAISASSRVGKGGCVHRDILGSENPVPRSSPNSGPRIDRLYRSIRAERRAPCQPDAAHILVSSLQPETFADSVTVPPSSVGSRSGVADPVDCGDATGLQAAVIGFVIGRLLDAGGA